jgi:ergothioneine biosynthesis protein EgtB
MQDGGYEQVDLWLSDGWEHMRRAGWRHPLYWFQEDGEWWEFTLAGPRPLNPAAPVSHVSYYEADAFARWAGMRLPREAELERELASRPMEGNFHDQGHLHPVPGSGQWYGDLWEWTCSPYTAYPGFVPPAGAIGEYNGKFMCNQMVLRGGCCVTPKEHMRPTYRNFFYPHERWMFSGIRLATDS